MGISDFFRKKKTVVGMHVTYGLTSLGKTKAEQYSSSTPQIELLAALNENGVSTIPEIAKEMNMPPQKAKIILSGAIKSGYVKRVSQDE